MRDEDSCHYLFVCKTWFVSVTTSGRGSGTRLLPQRSSPAHCAGMRARLWSRPGLPIPQLPQRCCWDSADSSPADSPERGIQDKTACRNRPKVFNRLIEIVEFECNGMCQGPTKSAHVIQIWLLGGDSDLVFGSGNRHQLVRYECG